MGFPYHELIPVAILLDNPGITREEFVKLVGQTHYGWREFEEKDRWDSFDQEKKDYYSDLEHLASVLGLEYSEKYRLFNKPSLDEHGLNLNAPFLRPLNEKEQESGYK